MGSGQLALIDPAKVAFYTPKGLRPFKQNLFDRVGREIERHGGRRVNHDPEPLRSLPDDWTPVVGCQPESRPLIQEWTKRGRRFVYWDRGYCRRVFATWLPRGDNGGFYRWHVNGFQMRAIRDVPGDRWKRLKTDVLPWSKNGRHILIAAPTKAYAEFHGCERWTDEICDALARVTDRPLMIRAKESKRPLVEDLKGAHALVTHGSNTANEAVILGCPVFVHPSCAAALVGLTDVTKIETPVYPDREPWLYSLAYSQFDERELVDGTLWRLMT